MLGALIVCGICGVIAAAPFRDFDTSLPAWIALAPVLRIVALLPSWRRALVCAFWFALVWTTCSFSFLWRCAFEGAIALSIYTSVLYALGFLAIRQLAVRNAARRLSASEVAAPMRCGALVFGSASVWVLLEIFRSVIPILYFPWLLLGHALLYNAPLRQAADLAGAFGLSFLIITVNAWLAFGLLAFLPEKWNTYAFPGVLIPGGAAVPCSRKSSWRTASIIFALIFATYIYGLERIQRLAPRLQPGTAIAVIQGNIVDKVNRTKEQLTEQMIQHVRLHREAIEKVKKAEGTPPALVCWAETMVPGFMNTDVWGDYFRREVKDTGVPALAGSNYLEPGDEQKPLEEQHIRNTAYMFDASGKEILRYYKRRLVAFGEYVPFARENVCARLLTSVTRDQYIPGDCASPVVEVGGYRIAVNLCVEDIHPALAREAARDGADTLLNVTNDGWFYGTYGPRAHLQAAAWRAIEVRRPLLRITNTGRTAAVDPLGEIELVVPPEVEAVGAVHLKRIDGGGAAIVTPYMVLGESGVAAIFGSVLLLCAGLITLRRS